MPRNHKADFKIKQSFVFTMMNMLHTRVEYNNAKK